MEQQMQQDQMETISQSQQPQEEEEQCKVSEEEQEHLESVCNSFRQYATFMKCARLGRMQRIQNYTTQEEKSLLPKWMLPNNNSNNNSNNEESEFSAYHDKQKIYQDAYVRNQFFFDRMLQHAGMKNSQDVQGETSSSWCSQDSMDKVNAVLRSIARDWSKEGAQERSSSYLIILDALKRYLPIGIGQLPQSSLVQLPTMTKPPRILVPGLGLARLALEIYALGYEVQGNEFSLHMLLASDFILNGCSVNTPYAISPYLDSNRNVCRTDDPIRKLFIPDIDPGAAMQNHDDSHNLPDFSVAAGEFLAIYSKPEHHSQWDAVASCFFLDTAPNIIQYVQVIYNLLAPNGLLINFGPLHYHWSGPPLRPDNTSFTQYIDNYKQHLDDRYLQSFELSWEDLREVLHNIGFEIIEERLGLKAKYTADTMSFMSTDYRCIYFVARKTVVGAGCG